MSILDLSNVVTVSVSAVPTGVSEFNTGNIALFTTETAAESFPEQGFAVLKDPTLAGTYFGTSSATYKKAVAVFNQPRNILIPGGSLVIIPLLQDSSVYEDISDAIERTKGLVPYYGVLAVKSGISSEFTNIAAELESTKKIFATVLTADNYQSVGDANVTAGNSHFRSLARIDSTDTASANAMDAAYLSRLLSVDYSGSKTTLSMQLKQLNGVSYDSGIDQTVVTNALASGVDIYPSQNGYPSLLTSGANLFSDQVVNRDWLRNALQVALFNYQAQTATKIPQTEDGMTGMKDAVRKVMDQAVANGYCAPGAWNSPNYFGNPVTLASNVSQFGYYIYSTPISKQNQSDRSARKAPLIQVALKEAGAEHSVSLIVNVEP